MNYFTAVYMPCLRSALLIDMAIKIKVQSIELNKLPVNIENCYGTLSMHAKLPLGMCTYVCVCVYALHLVLLLDSQIVNCVERAFVCAVGVCMCCVGVVLKAG